MKSTSRHMNQDRRRRMRLKRTAHVKVVTADQRIISGKLRDISLNSLYVDIPEGHGNFLVEGEPVRTTISLRNGTNLLSISTNARLVRFDDMGFAMTFEQPLQWWPIFVMLPETKSRNEIQQKTMEMTPQFASLASRAPHTATHGKE